MPKNKELDSGLMAWIDKLSSKWGILHDESALCLGESEIENRMDSYPILAEAVLMQPISSKAFADAARNC